VRILPYHWVVPSLLNEEFTPEQQQTSVLDSGQQQTIVLDCGQQQAIFLDCGQQQTIAIVGIRLVPSLPNKEITPINVIVVQVDEDEAVAIAVSFAEKKGVAGSVRNSSRSDLLNSGQFYVVVGAGRCHKISVRVGRIDSEIVECGLIHKDRHFTLHVAPVVAGALTLRRSQNGSRSFGNPNTESAPGTNVAIDLTGLFTLPTRREGCVNDSREAVRQDAIRGGCDKFGTTGKSISD
jgi:hypothetical protein